MRSCSNLKLSSALFLTILPLCVSAQHGSDETAKEPGLGNYMFPINPGQTNYLSGTMGELRDTHFHGGIDIRTNNRIGLPVRATQDGYISRVSIMTGGYGTAIYVAHPDGKVSVYGHLDKIKGRLSTVIRQEQYKKKSFDLDIRFNAEEFPVTKGDTIALSGNTGSSQGPHLHFEIREGRYELNPLKFGFTEIKDNIPPAPQKIALRTLDKDSRINDRFGRFEFSVLRKSATEFSLPVPILAHGRIGIELLADDRMNDSPGRCGINYIDVYSDDEKIFTQVIDKVDIEETRAILSLVDFKTLEMKGKRYNKLYIDDGNHLEFYTASNGGIINITDKDKLIRISMKDESGNQSQATLTLKSTPVSEAMVLGSKKPAPLQADLLENILTITSGCSTEDNLLIYTAGKKTELAPAYKGGYQHIYLIDLRKVLPDSVVACSGTLNLNYKAMIPSETEYTYFSDMADIRFPARALYDTMFLNAGKRFENGREIFILGHRTTPLHREVQITLKPVNPLTPAKNLSVYRKEGRGYAYVGGEWVNGKVRISARDFGEFTFLTDSLAPAITRVRLDGSSARFRIRDNLSGIAYYEASINGQWLLMNYDYKSGILQSDKLDPKQPLKGDFELKVVDRAGNERIFRQKIQ